jgi:thiol-disulfide isomerase/thioredoxin
MKNWQWLAIALFALTTGLLVNTTMKKDFVTLDGEAHQWQDFEGSWVIVNYFARWCAPCLREIPELNRFYFENKSVPIFAISFDPLSQEQLSELRDTYDIAFPILYSIESLPWTKAPNTLPHTIIIDPKGRVVKQLKGEQSAESLSQILVELQGS